MTFETDQDVREMAYQEPDTAARMIVDMSAEIVTLREALEYIAGCFVYRDKRVTYGDPTETMDRIRDRANEALCR